MKRLIAVALILVLSLTSLALADEGPMILQVNNKEIQTDLGPIIEDGEILLPIRAILEALDYELSWNGETRKVLAKKGDRELELGIGEDFANFNGEKIDLERPARILKGRTLVGRQLIERLSGGEVLWDKEKGLVSINKEEDYKRSLTYSNLLDQDSQTQVRELMESAGIPEKSLDLFFQELNYYNEAIEAVSLIEGFHTVEGLKPEYDIVSMYDLWDGKHPLFLGNNCRIVTYGLMKDSMEIGKIDTSRSDWLIFDEMALRENPKDIFTEEEMEEFRTFYSRIPTELTKDVDVHVEKIKKDLENKEIKFNNSKDRSIVSVYFHDEEGYLFIGHMGLLIPSEDGDFLFIEKLSFLEPYQAIKFTSKRDLNDYLMNRYDISWNQPTSDPIIMDNGELIEGYRENPNKGRD